MNTAVEAIKDCFERRIDIGASTPEPSVWDMIRHYYTSHGIPPDMARRHADSVQNVFANTVSDRLRITA